MSKLAYCGALIVVSLLMASSMNAQSKEIREHRLFIDGGPGPATVDDLVNNSTVILDGIITGERPADYVPTYKDGSGPSSPLVQTAYTIKVAEFFKNNSSTGRGSEVSLQMLLPGGRRDRGSYIEDYSDRNFPTPKLGEEYILFLRLETTSQGSWFVPTMGLAESVFLITPQDFVVPRGGGPVAQFVKKYHGIEFKRVLRTRPGGL